MDIQPWSFLWDPCINQRLPYILIIFWYITPSAFSGHSCNNKEKSRFVYNCCNDRTIFGNTLYVLWHCVCIRKRVRLSIYTFSPSQRPNHRIIIPWRNSIYSDTVPVALHVGKMIYDCCIKSLHCEQNHHLLQISEQRMWRAHI